MHKTSAQTLQRLADALGLRFVMGFESGPAENPVPGDTQQLNRLSDLQRATADLLRLYDAGEIDAAELPPELLRLRPQREIVVV